MLILVLLLLVCVVERRRIRGLLISWQVIDCSDVIIQVLDARDPMGTRSPKLEKQIVRRALFRFVRLFLLNSLFYDPGSNAVVGRLPFQSWAVICALLSEILLLSLFIFLSLVIFFDCVSFDGCYTASGPSTKSLLCSFALVLKSVHRKRNVRTSS